MNKINWQDYFGLRQVCLNCGSYNIDLSKVEANPSNLVIVECDSCYYCLLYNTDTELLQEAGFNDN